MEKQAVEKNQNHKHSGIIAIAIIVGIIFGGIGGVFASAMFFPWLGDTLPVLQRYPIFRSVGTTQVIEKTEKQIVSEADAVVDAVKVVQPCVVSIMRKKDVTDFLGRTFKSEMGGTGFVITGDGLILTNRHVVSDSEADYTVITNDGENYEAKVKAIDPANDIAIIKIEVDDLPVVSLGYSDSLQVGQKAVVIGNALGEYSNTVTSGIISGINRTITAGDVGSVNYERLEGVIQTDAAINFGNSGGPLVDLAGNVVGVATAVDQGGSLIGFAIPINDVRSAIESYLENGEIVRPLLGVRYVTITPDFAKLNELPVEYGALIYSPNSSKLLPVIPGGPADKVGIEEGDIVIKIGGEDIGKDKSLTCLIQKNKPGAEVEIVLLRNGQELTVTATLDTFEQ